MPLTQISHSIHSPLSKLYVPGSHLSHEDWPVFPEYEPLLQGEHFLPGREYPSWLYKPLSQKFPQSSEDKVPVDIVTRLLKLLGATI
jgi:hypothetical protein